MTTATAPAYPLELAKKWLYVADIFAAAFAGENSAQHLRAAGVPKVILVDIDGDRLASIELEPHWEAVCQDAYEWAKTQEQFAFDAVVLDPWTNESPRVIERLPIFLRIARKHVVVGATVAERMPGFPGWKLVDVIRRSMNYGGVFWLVMERQ